MVQEDPVIRSSIPALSGCDARLHRATGRHSLGRALGHFLFSLIGLKRILFTNYFSKALKAPPSS